MRLRPMTQPEYEAWLEDDIKGYAQDKINAGTWLPEEAMERSAESLHSLLPEGLATRDQYLYTMEDEATGRGVGMIWLGKMVRDDPTLPLLYPDGGLPPLN